MRANFVSVKVFKVPYIVKIAKFLARYVRFIMTSLGLWHTLLKKNPKIFCFSLIGIYPYFVEKASFDMLPTLYCSFAKLKGGAHL